MLDLQINENTVNDMIEQAIYERVSELVEAKQNYFMTYNELAKYLNISKRDIEERLIKNGMKYYRIGNKLLFKRNEVDAFMNDLTMNMTPANNDIKSFTRLKEVSE